MREHDALGNAGLGPGTRLEIEVLEPSTHPSIKVQQLQRRVGRVTTSPVEVLKGSKVRKVLGWQSEWLQRGD